MHKVSLHATSYFTMKQNKFSSQVLFFIRKRYLKLKATCFLFKWRIKTVESLN